MATTLPSMKYQNNHRTVTGTITVKDNDVVLNCDTSSGAVTINLLLIPDNYWNTQYKLYIVDSGDNAATNNITINAGTNQTIDGQSSKVINTNGDTCIVYISSNSTYVTNDAAANIKGNIVLFNNMIEDAINTTSSYQTFSKKSYSVVPNTLINNGDILNIRAITSKHVDTTAPRYLPMIFINGTAAWDSTTLGSNEYIGQSKSQVFMNLELSKKSNTEAFLIVEWSVYNNAGNSGGDVNYVFYSTLNGFDFSNTSFSIYLAVKNDGTHNGTVYAEQLRIERFMV